MATSGTGNMPTARELADELLSRTSATRADDRTFGGNGSPDWQGLPLLNSAMTAAGRSITNVSEAWHRASNMGIGFTNNVVGLGTTIGITGLTVEQWRDSLERSGRGIMALSGAVGNMTEAAKNFSILSAELSHSDAGSQLRQMGISMAEYNNILAVSLAGRTRMDMYDAASRQDAIRAAAELAVEMDKVAQMSGVTRRDQLKKLQEAQDDERLQRALMQKSKDTGQDQQESFNKSLITASSMGIDRALTEIYTGGRLSQKGIGQLQTSGVSEATIRQLSNAIERGDTKAQERYLEQAQRDSINFTNSRQFTNAVIQTQGRTGEAFDATSRATIARDSALTAMINAEKKATGRTMTEVEAVNRQMEIIKFAQQSRDPTGKIDEGALLTRLGVAASNAAYKTAVQGYIAADRAARSVGGTAAVAGSTRLAESVGPALQAAVGYFEKVVKAFEEAIAKLPHVATGSKDVFGGGGSTSSADNWFYKAPGGQGQLLVANEEPEAIVPKTKVPEFLNDLFGDSLGKTIEDVTAPLGGQMRGLQSKMEGKMGNMEKDMPALFADIFGKQTGNIQPQFQQFGDLFNNIKTQVSSITPAPAVPSPAPAPAPASTATSIAAPTAQSMDLNDLKDLLVELNNTSAETLMNIASLVDNSDIQNRLVRRTSVNLNARG